MLRLPVRHAALLIFASAMHSPALNLHPGLIEEWSVLHGSTAGTLTVEWVDSAVGEGGTTDWTAHLVLRQFGTSTKYDTAVLRVFDLAYLADSGKYRPGREAAWLDPSCLLPFQREDLDSVRKALFYGKSFRVELGLPHFTMIHRLPQGAMAEFCSGGGRNPEVRTEVFGGWGTTCFQPLGSETQDCRPTPRFRTAPGIGVVAWRSMQRQEDWRLVRFDGRDVEHPPGRLLAGLHPGETWIWIQGNGVDPPLWRLTVLERLDDSVGIPGWSVEVERRDGKGGAVRSITELRIDTLQGWVGLGSETARLWSPYAKSMETRFALGFLADWAVAGSDTMTLVEDGLQTWVWGQTSSLTSWTLVAARNTGTLSIRSWSVAGSVPGQTISDIRWSLASHTSKPVSIERRPGKYDSPDDIRQLFLAEPGLLMRRISIDGRMEQGRGPDALRLLEKKGVGVFLIGEGREVRSIRAVIP